MSVSSSKKLQRQKEEQPCTSSSLNEKDEVTGTSWWKFAPHKFSTIFDWPQYHQAEHQQKQQHSDQCPHDDDHHTVDSGQHESPRSKRSLFEELAWGW